MSPGELCPGRSSADPGPGVIANQSPGDPGYCFERLSGKILIVEDDASVRRALHSALFLDGFDISEAPTGRESLALSRIINYDVVIIDVDVPGDGGVETCLELRRLHPHVAILAGGESDDPEQKIEALEAGADDYITKPFHIRELIARIRAALRRSRVAPHQNHETITVRDIEFHPGKRLVRKSGQLIHLTPKEFDLLHYLIAHAGTPIAHTRLSRVVWGEAGVKQVDCLRTFIRQLRKKLETDASKPEYLLTESYGYRFVDPAFAAGS